MDREEFLFLMYSEYGKVSDLVKRYIPEDLEDYSTIDRQELAIKIEADN